MPRSVFVLINLPKPCFSFKAAMGIWYSLNAFLPDAFKRSLRASKTGSLGEAKGSFTIMRLRSADPGTSTPSQKLSVANKTALPSSLNRSRRWWRSKSPCL